MCVNTARDNLSPQMVICMFFIWIYFFAGVHCLVGEGSELHCLASCIYQFFNKYNWLCCY
ncbi:hypothetical protein D6O59_07145 [Escherichia coli]|nr:hypothetical protein [Escherichia coli]PJW77583.1 hypothetical protein CWD60_25965 [Escherichia coli]